MFISTSDEDHVSMCFLNVIYEYAYRHRRSQLERTVNLVSVILCKAVVHVLTIVRITNDREWKLVSMVQRQEEKRLANSRSASESSFLLSTLWLYGPSYWVYATSVVD